MYEMHIGLEVHAQLLTDSKMFCGCSTRFGTQPNIQTCPVCLGMPGVLPVVNQKAVEHAVTAALALHSEVHERSVFARKNYFYPDLPKGYQISQYEEPLAEGGWIEIDTEEGVRRIGIRRIHLEEDAGKSVHDEAYVSENASLVDFNRCGVPLVEIVSEPDMRSPEEAKRFLTTLRHTVRWLGICDGNMEEGSLRCDANISVRSPTDEGLGMKTEVKNMNSFRGVERALAYEAQRHIRVLDSGKQVEHETRLWDEARSVTIPMRGKEETDDYRYFPDPDLIPLVVDKAWVEEIRSAMPELPDARKMRWMHRFGLSDADASILLDEKGIADYFESVAKHVSDPKQAANWVMGEVLRALKEDKISIDVLRIRPEQVAELIDMTEEGILSSTSGKVVFDEIVRHGGDTDDVVKRLGLSQISDAVEIETVVDRVVEEYPEEVQKYLKGRTGVLGFFIGQVMEVTGGKANPRLTDTILRNRLDRMK